MKMTIDPTIVRKYRDGSIPKRERSELIRRFNEMNGYVLKTNGMFWLKMEGKTTVTLSQKTFLETQIGQLWKEYNPQPELVE